MTEYDSEFYDTAYKRILSNQEEIDIIHKRCKEIMPHVVGETVLDLGCGLGVMALYTNTQYTGIDFSPTAIEYAIEANIDAAFICNTFNHAPNRKFDTVLLVEVLEHLNEVEREAVLKIARSRARQRIIIMVPVNIPMDSHVKPQWTMEELLSLLPNIRATEIKQVDRWWMGIYDL